MFNSWDRLPYLNDLRDGEPPSTTKVWDVIERNLFIANYQCMAAIDTDDVSGYYLVRSNFFSYSPFGVKADFGGHDQRSVGNVYAYLAKTSWFDGPAALWNTWGVQLPGHALELSDSFVVQDWCQDAPWPGPAYTCNSNFSIGMACAYPTPPDGQARHGRAASSAHHAAARAAR